MLFRTCLATAMAAALLSAAPALAQDATPTMSVNPGVLTVGGSATISYSDPAKAGQTIVVDIDNGMRRETVTDTVEIVLDANGNGTAEWDVPDWDMAKFNAPSVPEVGSPIVSGSPDQ